MRQAAFFHILALLRIEDLPVVQDVNSVLERQGGYLIKGDPEKLQTVYFNALSEAENRFQKELSENLEFLNGEMVNIYFSRVYGAFDAVANLMPMPGEFTERFPHPEKLTTVAVTIPVVHFLKDPKTGKPTFKKEKTEETKLEVVESIDVREISNYLRKQYYDRCREVLGTVLMAIEEIRPELINKIRSEELSSINSWSLDFSLTVDQLGYFAGLMHRTGLLNMRRTALNKALHHLTKTSTGVQPSAVSINKYIGSDKGAPNALGTADMRRVAAVATKLSSTVASDLSKREEGEG